MMGANRCKDWTYADETRLRVMWKTRLAEEAPADFDIRAARDFDRTVHSVKSKRNKLALKGPSPSPRSEPLACPSETLARKAARLSNAAFLAACANLAKPIEPGVKPEQRFTMLPPPALIGGASC